MNANENKTVPEIMAEMRKETGELKGYYLGRRIITRMEDERVLWYHDRIELVRTGWYAVLTAR